MKVQINFKEIDESYVILETPFGTDIIRFTEAILKSLKTFEYFNIKNLEEL